MQLRRVLLLFALVLGLSAVVAGLAPPAEDDSERRTDDPAATTPTATGVESAEARRVRFSAHELGAERRGRTTTRVVEVGASLSIEVSVREPGDVVLEGLGLHQSADPRAPARFDLLGPAEADYAVVFLPVAGEPRLVGRLRAVPDLPAASGG